MPRTSAQLYQDTLNIAEGDKDPITMNILLKKLALSAANAAAGLETISLFNGAPVNAVTAASIYTDTDSINENDRDPVTANELFKQIALTMAKIAMEIESIRTGMGPQAFVQEFEATITTSADVQSA